jgi:hypothetical protein
MVSKCLFTGTSEFYDWLTKAVVTREHADAILIHVFAYVASIHKTKYD